MCPTDQFRLKSNGGLRSRRCYGIAGFLCVLLGSDCLSTPPCVAAGYRPKKAATVSINGSAKNVDSSTVSRVTTMPRW